MKRNDIIYGLITAGFIIIVGYAIYNGVQMSERSFEEKCNNMYGNGTWVSVYSQVLWSNGEAKYAGDLSW